MLLHVPKHCVTRRESINEIAQMQARILPETRHLPFNQKRDHLKVVRSAYDL